MQRIFVDANILFSRTLRDWLFLLRNETDSMFTVFSTEDVIVEALYHLRRAHPRWDGERTVALQGHFRDNLDEVLGNFDASVEYAGNDPDDRHVHAAALACNADILLTGDRGFASRESLIDELPYEVFRADELFVLIDDSSSQAVLRVTDAQRRYWQERSSKGTQPKPLAEALDDAGCALFARRIQDHLKTLSGLEPPLNRKARRLLRREKKRASVENSKA